MEPPAIPGRFSLTILVSGCDAPTGDAQVPEAGLGDTLAGLLPDFSKGTPAEQSDVLTESIAKTVLEELVNDFEHISAPLGRVRFQTVMYFESVGGKTSPEQGIFDPMAWGGAEVLAEIGLLNMTKRDLGVTGHGVFDISLTPDGERQVDKRGPYGSVQFRDSFQSVKRIVAIDAPLGSSPSKSSEPIAIVLAEVEVKLTPLGEKVYPATKANQMIQSAAGIYGMKILSTGSDYKLRTALKYDPFKKLWVVQVVDFGNLETSIWETDRVNLWLKAH